MMADISKLVPFIFKWEGEIRVEADGIVGEKTLKALNGHPDPGFLFEEIKQERIAYIE